jgi:hypothetical protein
MTMLPKAFLAMFVITACGRSDSEPARAPDVPAHANIRVNAPSPGALITSPLTVAGEARGSWYFEASFPVRLVDAEGRELVVVPAQARGEWMTPNFVPFEVQLTFVPPSSPGGLLILQKDNPSGLPEHADSLVIPVRFR